MDFGTIRNKLEASGATRGTTAATAAVTGVATGVTRGEGRGEGYETAEGFAEDIRLVFRNALLFNKEQGHPVHIAARELSSRFEEKFRLAKTILVVGSKGSGSGTGRRGSGSGSGRTGSGDGSMEPGPRVNCVTLPPSLFSGSSNGIRGHNGSGLNNNSSNSNAPDMSHLVEMHTRMMDMKLELQSLRVIAFR